MIGVLIGTPFFLKKTRHTVKAAALNEEINKTTE